MIRNFIEARLKRPVPKTAEQVALSVALKSIEKDRKMGLISPDQAATFTTDVRRAFASGTAQRGSRGAGV
jgi:hypothetical protein